RARAAEALPADDRAYPVARTRRGRTLEVGAFDRRRASAHPAIIGNARFGAHAGAGERHERAPPEESRKRALGLAFVAACADLVHPPKPIKRARSSSVDGVG